MQHAWVWFGAARLAGTFVLLAVPPLAGAAGAPPTHCNDLCGPGTNPCVVSATVHVVPGSVIDCRPRAVQVSGGALLAHDSLFVLKAGSLLVTNGGRIESDCPAGGGHHGFIVDVAGTIGVPGGGSGKLAARCPVTGGQIELTAGVRDDPRLKSFLTPDVAEDEPTE